MTIKDFNDQLDIVRVVSDCVEIKKSGKSYRGLCPFHDDTNNPGLSVDEESGRYQCFACGAKGDALQFYKDFHKLEVTEAMEELAEKYNIQYTKSQWQENSKGYFDCMEAAVEFYRDRLWENREQLGYLMNKRNLKTETISEFRLGYAPKKWDALYTHLKGKGFSLDTMEKLGLVKKNDRGVWDFFRHRIIIPIFKFGTNKVIALGGRLLEKRSERDAKYMNSAESPIFRKSHNLYGHPGVVRSIKKIDYSLLLEGYFDVMTAWQNGLGESVAGLGTAFTDEQSELLTRYSRNALICYDNDAPGKTAAAKAVVKFCKRNVNTKVVSLEGGKDIDEILSKEGGLDKLKEFSMKASHGIPYLVDYSYGDKTDRFNERMEKLERCRKAYGHLEKIYQEEFVRELETKTGNSFDSLKEQMEKLTADEERRRERDVKKKRSELDKARNITLELLEGGGISPMDMTSYMIQIKKCETIEKMRIIYKEIKKRVD